MKRLLAAGLVLMLGAVETFADDCASLAEIALPDVTIVNATVMEQPVEHCYVTARIGESINFAVWLPADWNGRFLMGGGGGFVGSVQNHAMGLGALERGYATAGTDTGHQGFPVDGRWALDNYEAMVNYGHLAIHRVTAVSKAMIAAHYDDAPGKSFFAGCSNGGRQALIFAQRYPQDFDGIIAGAPALDFRGTAAQFTQITQGMYPSDDDHSTPLLSPADREHIAQSILAACDAEDGVEDGLLLDPRECDFDVDELDLTEEQLALVRTIYDGASDAEGKLYTGFPLGGENLDGGWGNWFVGAENALGEGTPSAAYGFGIGIMRYFLYHDPEWRYEGYDFADYRRRFAPLNPVLAANNPDLDAFRSRGGKLLMYHGWSDAALSALSSIDYVDDVYRRDEAATDDVRLFLLPGVLHCAGGPGADQVDYLSALEEWDRSGEPPETLTANFSDGSGSRKLCAHPAVARFEGGDDRAVDSFRCDP